jgi:hypothetical protein
MASHRPDELRRAAKMVGAAARELALGAGPAQSLAAA